MSRSGKLIKPKEELQFIASLSEAQVRTVCVLGVGGGRGTAVAGESRKAEPLPRGF